MSSNFPVNLDNFNNPTSEDYLDTPGVEHSAQHSNANDAVEALEIKVGINNSAVPTSLDYKVTALQAAIASAITSLTAGGSLRTGSVNLDSIYAQITDLSTKQPLDSDLTAIAALSTTTYGRALLTLANATSLTALLNTATGSLNGLMSAADKTAFNALGATYQPLDSDLTSIAALTTTSYGRAFLALANAAAGRAALGLGTASTSASTDFAAKVDFDALASTIGVTGGRVYVENHGAIADGKLISDGAVSSGSTSFTSAAGGFTTSDTGKTISIAGADVAGAALITTVTYVNATTLTLAVAASTTVSAKPALMWLTDNSAAIEAAILKLVTMGGGTLVFGSGVYVVSRTILTAWSSVRVCINLMKRDNIKVQGAGIGATTVALMPGSVGSGEDWHVFGIRESQNFAISDLTIYGSWQLLTGAGGNEHMHGIMLQSSKVGSLARVNIIDVRGDCIQFLGNNPAIDRFPTVSDISVVDCNFINFRRDALSWQRNATRILISHCYMLSSAVGGNSCIDMEPTGVGPVTDVEISDCYMQDNNQTPAQVSLSGNSGTEPAARIQFLRNTVIGGCCSTVDIADSKIEGNTFLPAHATAPLLLFSKSTERVRIANNRIVSPVGGTGDVLRLVTAVSRYPNAVTIEGNIIEVNGAGNAILFDTPQDDILVLNNRIIGGATAGALTAIQMGGNGLTGANHYNWAVRGNVVRNFVTGILAKVYDTAEPLTGLRITDNDVSDNRGTPAAVTGIQVTRGTGSARFATNVIMGNNEIGPEVTTPTNISSLILWYLVGGNQGGRGWYVVINGTPEGVVSANIGSLCSDATNGNFYRKASGTGNTGWVLQPGASLASTTQTVDYTLALADVASVVEVNKATAQTTTIPTNATVAFPIGTIIELYQQGVGQITVSASGGVTLRAPGGAKSRAQFSTISLRKRATDEWVVSGDVAV